MIHSLLHFFVSENEFREHLSSLSNYFYQMNIEGSRVTFKSE